MDSTLIFLVNPNAGGAAARRLWPRIEAALRADGVPFEARATESWGEAAAQARAWATQPVRAVVAVGGDGTVQAVANGLMQAFLAGAGALPLGVVALGRNNHFAHAVGLRRDDPVAAARQLARAEARRVDLGVARAGGAGGEDRFFVNGLGAGLDAALALGQGGGRAARSTLARLWKALGETRPFDLSLTMEGQTRALSLLSLTVGNGPCHAGGFCFTPAAAPDDGQLDLCLIRNVARPQALALGWRAARGGPLRAAAVTHHRARRLVLQSLQPLRLHADGEPLPFDGTHLEIEVLPAQLPVLA